MRVPNHGLTGPASPQGGPKDLGSKYNGGGTGPKMYFQEFARSPGFQCHAAVTVR